MIVTKALPWNLSAHRFLIGATAAFLFTGCVQQEIRYAHTVPLDQTTKTIAEQELLDVLVVTFDPGVPDGEIDKELLEELLRDGVFTSIRRTEARYMAVQLKETLQATGYWGAVRVSPSATNATDVTVTAAIQNSDGDRVRVAVEATDAAGRLWLKKSYFLETAAAAYDKRKYPDTDPYQDLFNSIANDLNAQREKLSATDRAEIRSIAELRYAADLSPEAFGAHVEQNRRGRYEIRRLPADGDPMYERALRVREREYMVVDLLNGHYDRFHSDVEGSYDSWRTTARQEAQAVREVRSEARWRTAMGAATLIAAILYSRNSDNGFSDRVISNAGTFAGIELLKSGFQRRREAQLYAANLEEVSESFDEELAPLVVEIGETVHRLDGNAQEQYEEWRRLLKDIYQAETGLVSDIDVYAEELQTPDPTVSGEEPEIEAETNGPGSGG